MAKDPICGMDVQEKDARNMIRFEHETFYFCSNQCKEEYTRKSGANTTAKRKGMFARFLEKLAKENEDSFGGTPPSCH